MHCFDCFVIGALTACIAAVAGYLVSGACYKC